MGKPGDGAALLLRLIEAMGSRVARLDTMENDDDEVRSLWSMVGVLLLRFSTLLLLPSIEEYLRSARENSI